MILFLRVASLFILSWLLMTDCTSLHSIEWGKRYLQPIAEWFGLEFPDQITTVSSHRLVQLPNLDISGNFCRYTIINWLGRKDPDHPVSILYSQF